MKVTDFLVGAVRVSAAFFPLLIAVVAQSCTGAGPSPDRADGGGPPHPVTRKGTALGSDGSADGPCDANGAPLP